MCASFAGKVGSWRSRDCISSISSWIGKYSNGYPQSSAFCSTLRITILRCVKTLARQRINAGGVPAGTWTSGVTGAASLLDQRSSNVLHLTLVHLPRLSPRRSCTVPSAKVLETTPLTCCMSYCNAKLARFFYKWKTNCCSTLPDIKMRSTAHIQT